MNDNALSEPNALNEQNALIEQIVRRVLARLQAEAANSPAANVAETPAPRVLRVAARVVTWLDLRDHAGDADEIVVAAGAVVTPAARDELRARGVRLRREGDDNQTNQGQNTRAARQDGSPAQRPRDPRATLRVAAAAAAQGPAALARQLTLAGHHAAPLELERAAEKLPQAIDQLAAALAGGGRATLVTGKPALAARLANRHDHVRAAWVADRASLNQAASEMPLNLLILDEQRQNLARQRDLSLQFLKQTT